MSFLQSFSDPRDVKESLMSEIHLRMATLGKSLAGSHLSLRLQPDSENVNGAFEGFKGRTEVCSVMRICDLTPKFNGISNEWQYSFSQNDSLIDDNDNEEMERWAPFARILSIHRVLDVGNGKLETTTVLRHKLPFQVPTTDVTEITANSISKFPFTSRQDLKLPLGVVKAVFSPSMGYHPTLNLDMPGDTACILTLPEDIFADEYQIKDIKFPTGVSVDVFGVMDLETPVDSKASKNGLVRIVRKKLQGNSNISIPLHLRYQTPSYEPYTSVTLPLPLCFSTGTHLPLKFPIPPTHESLIPTEFSSIPLRIIADASQLRLSVPTGLIHDTPLVMWGTSIVTILGAIFVLYVLFHCRPIALSPTVLASSTESSEKGVVEESSLKSSPRKSTRRPYASKT